jgi:hypothetical protein
MHDFPHQHVLLFFGLLASGNILPGNHKASNLALVITPRPDVALQPKRPPVSQLQMVIRQTSVAQRRQRWWLSLHSGGISGNTS